LLKNKPTRVAVSIYVSICVSVFQI